MKLSEYAVKYGVTYRTAWNRYKKGKIPGSYMDNTGHIQIKDPEKNIDFTQCAIYCRVSSHKQKQDLERQVGRVTNFSINNGYIIKHIVREIGSGVNDHRKKMIDLLHKDDWNTLIVEHQDRLTRFGFNYLKVLLELANKKVLVINQVKDDTTDLVQDIVSILYSFSARMYGRRNSSKSKAKKALEVLGS